MWNQRNKQQTLWFHWIILFWELKENNLNKINKKYINALYPWQWWSNLHSPAINSQWVMGHIVSILQHWAASFINCITFNLHYNFSFLNINPLWYYLSWFYIELCFTFNRKKAMIIRLMIIAYRNLGSY